VEQLFLLHLHCSLEPIVQSAIVLPTYHDPTRSSAFPAHEAIESPCESVPCRNSGSRRRRVPCRIRIALDFDDVRHCCHRWEERRWVNDALDEDVAAVVVVVDG